MRALLLIGAALVGCTTQYPAGDDPWRGQMEAHVQDFIDGDTADVELDDGTVDRVRLLGVDTPETDKHDPLDSECYAVLAWQESADLFDGEIVQLTFDSAERGVYNRLLVYMYRDSDGLFLNEHLIRDGFAVVSGFEVSMTDEFEQLQEEAQLAQRGLWGECSP